MKYVVLRSGGKQYIVSEGEILDLERLSVEVGKELEFDDILFYANEGEYVVGSPKVEGVLVKGVILEEKKGEKIRVSQFKAKARHRRVIGHRSIFTRVKIEAISKK